MVISKCIIYYFMLHVGKSKPRVVCFSRLSICHTFMFLNVIFLLTQYYNYWTSTVIMKYVKLPF